MVRRSRKPARAKKRATDKTGASPYVLLLRGPDGRLRAEQFKDAAAYRVRLAALQSSQSGAAAVSIEEIFALLGV